MGLKLGVQEKKWKIYAAAGLGVVVVGLAIYNLKDSFGGSSLRARHPGGRSDFLSPRKFIDHCERIARSDQGGQHPSQP